MEEEIRIHKSEGVGWVKLLKYTVALQVFKNVDQAEEHKKYLIDTRVEDYIKFHSIAQIFIQIITYQINGIDKLDDGNLYSSLILKSFRQYHEYCRKSIGLGIILQFGNYKLKCHLVLWNLIFKSIKEK